MQFTFDSLFDLLINSVCHIFGFISWFDWNGTVFIVGNRFNMFLIQFISDDDRDYCYSLIHQLSCFGLQKDRNER